MYYLIKNSQAVKKGVRPLKRLWWKKMWNPRWRPRNGCDGRLMVKILITTIQVNLVPLGQLAQNSPELSLLKFLPLTYHHSHFLAATLDFTSFFTIAFSRAALLFLQLGCFLIRFHFFLYLYTPKPTYGQLWGFLTYIFFLTTGKRKRWSRFINTLTHSDFISKCTNFIYNAYIKSS